MGQVSWFEKRGGVDGLLFGVLEGLADSGLEVCGQRCCWASGMNEDMRGQSGVLGGMSLADEARLLLAREGSRSCADFRMMDRVEGHHIHRKGCCAVSSRRMEDNGKARGRDC